MREREEKKETAALNVSKQENSDTVTMKESINVKDNEQTM